jgi:death-on-curing protein
MKEPVWIRDDVVAAIHLRQVAEHGGAEGIRDQGLLSSALARPRNLFAYQEGHPDLASLAAAYAFGIARNHPFLDGNKRTSFVVCRTFLLLSGKDVSASREEKYLTFMALARGDLSEDDLAAWIREHLAKSGRSGRR